MFERYENFEFYKIIESGVQPKRAFERYENFEFYKISGAKSMGSAVFERYVNIYFFLLFNYFIKKGKCLRDM